MSRPDTFILRLSTVSAVSRLEAYVNELEKLSQELSKLLEKLKEMRESFVEACTRAERELLRWEETRGEAIPWRALELYGVTGKVYEVLMDLIVLLKQLTNVLTEIRAIAELCREGRNAPLCDRALAEIRNIEKILTELESEKEKIESTIRDLVMTMKLRIPQRALQKAVEMAKEMYEKKQALA